MSTIFSKIIAGEAPADIVHDDPLVLAFRDIAPQAPTHVLIIPKKPIRSMAQLTDQDEAVMGHCVVVAAKIAAAEGLDNGYRLITNTGSDGGQEVPHLHFHLVGGRRLGRMIAATP